VARRLHPGFHDFGFGTRVAVGYVLGTGTPFIAVLLDTGARVAAVGTIMRHFFHTSLVVGVLLGGIGKVGAKAKGREAVLDPLLVDETEHLGVAVGGGKDGEN